MTGRAGWALLLAAAASLFAGLSASPLFDLDEGAFTAATLEMFERGDFLSTYLNGVPRYDKPILAYWLQALPAWGLGFNEFALRLPSALMGLAWAAMAYGLALRLYDRQTAVAAAVLTATTLGVSFISHAATADALLNACIAGAVFAQFLWFRDGRPQDFYLAWAAMGLGFLAKGPVAVALPLGTAVLYCASRGEWRRLFAWLFAWRGLLLFLAIAAPWYVAVTWAKGPGFLEGFFLKHNVGRFSGAMEGHRGGVFYYVPVLLLVTLPYTGLLLSLGARLKALWRDDFARYALILFALVFVLFSASATKLPHYLFYGLSALLVLLARELREAKSRWLLLPGLLLFAGLLFFPDAVEATKGDATPYYQAMLADLDQHFGAGYRVWFALSLLAVAWFMLERRINLGLKLLITGLLAAYGLVLALLPAIGGVLQQPIKEAGLAARGAPAPLLMYGLNTPSFSVYAGRVVYKRAPQAGETALTVADRLADLPPHEVLYRNKAIVLVQVRP